MVNKDLVYKSLELLEEATNEKSKSKEINYYLGKYFYNKFQYVQALELIDKEELLSSSNDKIIYLKGLLLYNLNRLKESEECFKSLMNTHKEEKALYYLGLIEYDNCNYFTSLLYFNYAKDKYGIDKDNHLYYSIKLVNLKLNDVNTYLTLHKSVFNFTITNEAYELKSMIKIEKGNYDNAMIIITNALQVYQNDPGLLTQRIICLYYQKRYSECIAKGEQLLLNTNTSLKIKHKINVYLYIGYSYLHLKNEAQSKEYFRKYQQMETNIIKVDDYLINKCNIKMNLNMNLDGIDAKLSEVLYRNPNNFKAVITLLNVYMKEKKYQLMKILYEKIKHLLNKDNDEHKKLIDNCEINYKIDQMKFIQTKNSLITTDERSLINESLENITIYDYNYSINKQKKLGGVMDIKIASYKSDSDSDLDSISDNGDLISKSETLKTFKLRFKNKDVVTVISETSNKLKQGANQNLDLNAQIEEIKKNIISKLNHPNLCIQYSQQKKDLYENLHYLICTKKTQFSNEDKHGIICQIANVLEFLHNNKVKHGYVNTKNILIDQSQMTKSRIYYRAELLLFSSIVLNSQKEEYLIEYTPPEYETEDKAIDENSLKGDVYSFGVVIYKILTNEKFPFPKYKDKVKEIIENKFELNEIDTSLEYRSLFVEIIKNCCFINKYVRPTMQTIVKDLSFLFDSYNQYYIESVIE